MTFRGGSRDVPTNIPDYVRPVVKLVQRHPMVSAARELHKSTVEYVYDAAIDDALAARRRPLVP